MVNKIFYYAGADLNDEVSIVRKSYLEWKLDKTQYIEEMFSCVERYKIRIWLIIDWYGNK